MHRYSNVMIALHWLTAALILAAWFTAEGGREVRADPPLIHFTLGLSVLLLTIPRLLARWTGLARRPQVPQGPGIDLAGTAGHVLLYVFLRCRAGTPRPASASPYRFSASSCPPSPSRRKVIPGSSRSCMRRGERWF